MSKGVKEVRLELLAKFRQMNAHKAYSLPPRWLHGEYLAGLNANGRAAYEQARAELIAEGVVQAMPGPQGETLKLTEAGVEVVYPPPEPDKIARAVLDKFAAIGAQEGHSLPPYWLQRDYEPSLNPREQAIFQDTLRNLAHAGLVAYIAYPVPNLRITAAGLEALHTDDQGANREAPCRRSATDYTPNSSTTERGPAV